MGQVPVVDYAFYQFAFAAITFLLLCGSFLGRMNIYHLWVNFDLYFADTLFFFLTISCTLINLCFLCINDGGYIYNFLAVIFFLIITFFCFIV